jgi:hypothetical protein
MKFKFFILILTSSINTLSAPKVSYKLNMEYTCKGDVLGYKDSVTVYDNQSFEVTRIDYLPNNIEKEKTLKGTNYNSYALSFNLFSERQTINRVGELVKYSNQVSKKITKGNLKELKKVKVGLTFKKEINQNKENTFNSTNKLLRTDYHLRVLEKQKIEDSALGKVDSFHVLISEKRRPSEKKSKPYGSEFIGNYSPKHGYLRFTWIDYSESNIVWFESCVLKSWSKE